MQCFHRSVQPLHTYFEGWKKVTYFAVRNRKIHIKIMSKRVRITNNSLNSYGTRVLTAGMDVEQYCRNPVLLYMHDRGNVIGYVKDLKVEGDEITGELMFDEASELSQRCKKQYEFGSLRMVSVGIDIKEMSESPEHLVEGQTRPTITRSKLFEVSLVDVGANDDAIRLTKDGATIELGKDGTCQIPLLNTNNQKIEKMELKDFALMLGLAETADEAAVRAEVDVLLAAKKNANTLLLEKEQLMLASITQVVETAISEKRINADRKQQFINLGKTTGIEELKNIFAAMSPQQKLSAVISSNSGTPVAVPVTYSKLSEVPANMIVDLRENNREEYARLYKAEYGMECNIE